jgi:hypothetical protein
MIQEPISGASDGPCHRYQRQIDGNFRILKYEW